MIEFITENSIWLIIFGLLIVMAMIGYAVEKRDGKKEKVEKPKKSSMEEPVTKVEEKKEEKPPVQEEPVAPVIPEPEMVAEPVALDSLVSSDDEIDLAAVQAAVQAVMTESGEDLSVPFGDPIEVKPESTAISYETSSVPQTSSTDILADNDISYLFTESKQEESTASSDELKF